MREPSMRRLILCAVLLTACIQDDPTGPGTAFSIADGAHGGSDHFFFLSPIGKGASFEGEFDPGLAPEVHICELSGDACGADVAMFTMTEGEGSEVVRMELAEEQYVVNWHTRRAFDGAGLDPAATYRVRVLVEGDELGHADVRPAKGNAKKTIDRAAFVVIQPGQTVAIKFRIEVGAAAAPGEVGGPVRRDVAVSAFHSCALDGTGAAWCWGSGFSGQLGNGEYDEAPTPAAVLGGHRFTALALGSFHTCGLDDVGAAWCWGSNSQGALGIGVTGGDSSEPVAVLGAPAFVRITAGQYFTCGLTGAGAAWCWGGGSVGQIGDGTTTAMQPSPTAVAGAHVFAAIDAGAQHVCGIDDAGAAWCWGGNGWGQMGNGVLSTTYPYVGGSSPVAVAGGMTFEAIGAGVNHTCALSAGAAFCWGAGYDGQVGDGTLEMTRMQPTATLGGHVFTAIDAAGSHTCAIDGDGNGWCWGSNRFGQIGAGAVGAPGRYTLPEAVLGGHRWERIAGGDSHTCGVTDAGAGYCWGSRALGDGVSAPTGMPTAVAGM